MVVWEKSLMGLGGLLNTRGNHCRAKTLIEIISAIPEWALSVQDKRQKSEMCFAYSQPAKSCHLRFFYRYSILFRQMRARSQIEAEISKIVSLASDAEKIVRLHEWLSTHPRHEVEYAFGFDRRKFRSTLGELWACWLAQSE
jgi:hypothetical protein